MSNRLQSNVPGRSGRSLMEVNNIINMDYWFISYCKCFNVAHNCILKVTDWRTGGRDTFLYLALQKDTVFWFVWMENRFNIPCNVSMEGHICVLFGHSSVSSLARVRQFHFLHQRLRSHLPPYKITFCERLDQQVFHFPVFLSASLKSFQIFTYKCFNEPLSRFFFDWPLFNHYILILAYLIRPYSISFLYISI